MSAPVEEKKEPKLAQRFLGKTGVAVSELCLGEEKGNFGLTLASPQTSVQILDEFVASGGNFLDTSNIYGSEGQSEQVIGEWMQTKPAGFRSQMFIATKAFFKVGPGMNDQGCSRKHLFDAIEGSLHRLKTDYVDLYQMHCYDNRTDICEMMRSLNSLVTAGKVRYIGMSNYCGWQLQKAVDYAHYTGLESVITLQPQYSLLTRSPEWELTDVCQQNNITMMAWSPLDAGWLTGRYHRGMQLSDVPADSRVAWAEEAKREDRSFSGRNNEHTWRTIDALLEVAAEAKCSPAQAALRWLIQNPRCDVIPIIGPRTVQHLRDNVGVCRFKLTPEQIQKLDKASEVPLPYPYSFIRKNIR